MTHKFLLSTGFTAAVALAGAQGALAGGFVAPAVEVDPVAVAPSVSGEWAGGYVGGSIGYSFGGDDEIGFDALGTGGPRETALGSVDVSGVTGGVHAGYRWQRGQWVFGPELAYEGGSVDDTATVTFGGATVDVESKVNSLLSLALKTGYAVSPQTLVYGSIGAVRGDFDYTVRDGDDSETEGYKKTGLAAGLGVEQMISPSLSVFAEYQYRRFGSSDLEFDVGGASSAVTVATPSHSNIKLGVNFRF